MQSQVIFRIDPKLKALAMKKAERDGVAFSAILKLATKAYVEGRLEVDFQEPRPFNAKTRRMLDKALKEIEQGKGLSPRFTNAADAIAYLDSL